jgi:NAD(P)-dependent dehydrogenase (short-subunit alcohol dehydrogenase family)
VQLGIEERPTAPLKEKGVYLITGGLGGIGLEMAGYLAKKVQAKLILTGRTGLPPREEWDLWLTSHPEKDPTSRKITKVRELEKIGSEVMIAEADIIDQNRMQSVVSRAEELFGRINGVIHAAGLPDGGVIPLRTRETTDRILAPKLKGTLVLDRLLEHMPLDFFVLCSSLRSVLGPFGQVGDCAANAFLDAFAVQKTTEDNIFTVSVNWDDWKEVGMTMEALKPLEEKTAITDTQSLLEYGISPSEGVAVFNKLLNSPYSRVVVSTRDLTTRFEELKKTATSELPEKNSSPAVSLSPRPQLSAEYTAPQTKFEEEFAEILKQFLGIEQVGIHDSFFELGINSLSMLHVNNILKKNIQKDVPLVTMFEYPTIYSLGQFLERLDRIESGKQEKEEPAHEQERANTSNRLLLNSINLLRNK